MTRSDRKRHHLSGSHLEMVVDRKLAYTVRLTSYKTRSHEEASRDRKCHVISGDWKWHLTRSHLEVAAEGRILAYNVRFISYKAVAPWGGSHVTGNDVTWLKRPEVTRKWCNLSGSDLEVPVEGRKLEYTVRLTSYKAWLAGRGSHVTGNDVIWPQMTGSDSEVTSFDRKSPGSERPKTCVYCAFDYLQGCSSQEEAVTDRIWRHVTSGDRKWFGNDVIWAEVTWK